MEIVTTNGVHALVHILASESADTSPVVIVGLGDVPLLSAEHLDVCRAESVTGNNGTLVGIVTRDSIVGGGDLGLSREFIEGASICLTLLEGITDHVRDLGESQEGVREIDQKIIGVGSPRGLALVERD